MSAPRHRHAPMMQFSVDGDKAVGHEREIASVVAPLCTLQDRLAETMELSKAEVGDLAVVFQSDAYGLTTSPTTFLSRPAPAGMLV